MEGASKSGCKNLCAQDLVGSRRFFSLWHCCARRSNTTRHKYQREIACDILTREFFLLLIRHTFCSFFFFRQFLATCLIICRPCPTFLPWTSSSSFSLRIKIIPKQKLAIISTIKSALTVFLCSFGSLGSRLLRIGLCGFFCFVFVFKTK